MIKKCLIIFVLIVLSVIATSQNEVTTRIEVIYDYTVDGDTVYFIEDGQRQKYRLLLIDTPEATTQIEPYGLEATAFTKDLLENASTIEIEYQEGNELLDQYGRKLVWVFVDGKLLQSELAKAGLVEKLYDNGKAFTYKREIEKAIEEAKMNKVGLYQ